MGVKKDEPKQPSRKSWLYYYGIVLIVTMLLNMLVFPSVMERSVREISYDQFFTAHTVPFCRFFVEVRFLLLFPWELLCWDVLILSYILAFCLVI